MDTKTKHQSIIDAEKKIANRLTEKYIYKAKVKELTDNVSSDLRDEMQGPIEKRLFRKHYYCPIHPEVELKVEIIERKGYYEWKYKKYYDGCGYLYWEAYT